MRRIGRPLLALALAAACDAGEPAPAPSPPAPRPAASPAPAAAETAAAALPAAGSVRVERHGDRFDVLANQVPPRDMLAELASAADFATEGADGALPAAPRTLALRDVPLERALAEILAGTPYAAHYEAAEAGALLASVRVGAVAAPAPAAAATPAAEMLARAKSRKGNASPGTTHGAGDPEEQSKLREQAAEHEQEREAEIDRQWQDPRADERLDAIGEMDAQGDDRAKLSSMLHGDPSPEVRAAAADALSDGDAFLVMDDLMSALDDGDPRVVAAAVRSLEDVYDDAPNPRIREKVMALKNAGDPDVREAVASFLEWIEE